jgi:hypothetical protein
MGLFSLYTLTKMNLHKQATPWNKEQILPVLCTSAIPFFAAGARTASDVHCARPEALKPGTAAPLISCPLIRQGDAVVLILIPLIIADISISI